MRTALAALALLACSPALAEDAPPKNWQEYQAAHSLACWAKEEPLSPPTVVEHQGYRYTFAGTTAKVQRLQPRAGAEIKLGVLSGIKELDAKTKTALDGFLAKFKAAGVEALLVGGDNAEDEDNLSAVFDYLAATNLPVYVILGNWEGRGPFNRALRAASEKHPNLINLQLVRRLDAEGYDVISLGGYTEKQYVRSSGGCIYKPEDAQYLAALAKSCDDPVVLLMHGPPKQSGKEAIDFVPDAGNVGDADVAKVIAELKIPFGVHGHILEAGQKSTDAGGKPVAQNKWVSSLFMNPGAANTLPWKLNNGQTAYGSAMLLTIKGKQGKYELLTAPKPE